MDSECSYPHLQPIFEDSCVCHIRVQYWSRCNGVIQWIIVTLVWAHFFEPELWVDLPVVCTHTPLCDCCSRACDTQVHLHFHLLSWIKKMEFEIQQKREKLHQMLNNALQLNDSLLKFKSVRWVKQLSALPNKLAPSVPISQSVFFFAQKIQTIRLKMKDW